MRYLIAFLKLFSILLMSLALIPVQCIVLLFAKGTSAYTIPLAWHWLQCRIFELKIDVIGTPSRKDHVFYVGNHLSHFDIFILGSLLRASFVAKEDLGKWPVVGFLCRLQQTAFISRDTRQAAVVRNNIKSMIEDGKNIILFPEGTSTRGDTVLDFKSSLFSLPLEYAGRGLKIQPFTIRILEVDGTSAQTKELKDMYAWDRDNPISMGAHMMNFIKLRGARLQVIFHPVIVLNPEEDRKILSKRVWNIVASPLVQSPASV